MKTKFLLAGFAAVLAFGALAPSTAKADHGSSGYYVTRVVGYDHCGRPIYRQVWVQSSGGPRYSYPSSGGYSGNHSSHGSHGSSGGFIHAPGIDIHFGGSGSSHHRNHGR